MAGQRRHQRKVNPRYELLFYTLQSYDQDMFSTRFNRHIILTQHAQLRMSQRQITAADILDVVDTGDTRYKDSAHLWAYKHLAGRADNLICAVLVLEDVVVVKTVMHNFDLEA